MVRKVLFYGNCQAGVLGEWLHDFCASRFEVFDCRDVGLEGFWGTKHFTVWSPENDASQSRFAPAIHKKIQECDIFVFQHTEERAIDELKTEYLCSTAAADKLRICLPNSRFLGYPVCKSSTKPFVEYVQQSILKERDEVCRYLKNESDPKFAEIVSEQYRASMEENRCRAKRDAELYGNAVEMNSFIEENWRGHLLFGAYSHPIGLYWRGLIERFFKAIDEPLGDELLHCPRCLCGDEIYNPRGFRFFRDIFPNIVLPSGIKEFHSLDDLLKQIL